ncbi:MAG: hypothetical protein JSU63_16695 [Phycisphaerales bacterium]|nr:MAG: hypothetical protein JSU63_16695 [Phycisphaerales bacterium]
MNEALHSAMAYGTPLSLLQKISTWVSWAIGGAIFLTVGWVALEPVDPLGPVSVLAGSNALVTLIQAAALAGVAAALGTIVAGRIRADVGVFAAALGMAAVSLKGATAEYLLVEHADLSSAFTRALAAKLALESVGWFAVVVVALAVSSLVARWFGETSNRPCGDGYDSHVVEAPAPAGFDVPLAGSRLFGCSPGGQTPPNDGLRHTVIAVGVGLVAMSFFSSGLSSRSIQHGQACFAVTAAVCVACYTAHRFAPVRSALWSILAIGVMALVGYLWASVRPVARGLPVNVPSSPFLRVLPIQFIAVGTAAALAMFWYMYLPPVTAKGKDETRANRHSLKGRGS